MPEGWSLGGKPGTRGWSVHSLPTHMSAHMGTLDLSARVGTQVGSKETGLDDAVQEALHLPGTAGLWSYQWGQLLHSHTEPLQELGAARKQGPHQGQLWGSAAAAPWGLPQALATS